METRDSIQRSLEARIVELDGRMGRIADRAAHTSKDAETRVASQLSSLRTRLAEIRTRLREKQDADDRADNAALTELGHQLNEMYAEMDALLK